MKKYFVFRGKYATYLVHGTAVQYSSKSWLTGKVITRWNVKHELFANNIGAKLFDVSVSDTKLKEIENIDELVSKYLVEIL